MTDNFISIRFKTNISDTYFDSEDDSDQFDEWFRSVLKELGIFDYSLVLTPRDAPGAQKLAITVDDFDYKHYLEVRVRVDDDKYTFDELYDNDPLLNYIDREVAPKLVTELNNVLTEGSLPMSQGDSFHNLKFDNGEFYCLLGYSSKFGFFPSGMIQNVPFVIEDDYDVYV